MVVSLASHRSHYGRHARGSTLAVGAMFNQEPQSDMSETTEPIALLSGYRVLDLSSSMGAFCGKLLRDLGMDVIKIEPPAGDGLRSEPPFARGHANREGSLRFAYLNAGKRGVTLDFTEESGRKLLLDLVARSDAVVESFEPGYLAEQKLGYDVLVKRQPTLILASLTGFGQDGPYAQFRNSDIVTMAMGGLLYISGDPEFPPCMPPETQSYYYASIFAAYGVILALWQREKRGMGAHIDISVQASMALHEHVAFSYSAEGRVIKRAGSQHQHNAPANLFKCKNGYISLFVTQNHWPFFLKVWEDHPPDLDDPKWLSNNERRANAAYINELVTSFTSRYSKEDLADLLQKNGIPALPVNTPREFMKDPHIQAREFFATVSHPVLGSFEQPAPPFTIDGRRPMPAPAPLLGQHNYEVFCDELGLGKRDLELLVADGIV
jgi:crotonobetainyl-CoA:carnitine CoA-transferase CaiB-like acyl-CoA transferase